VKTPTRKAKPAAAKRPNSKSSGERAAPKPAARAAARPVAKPTAKSAAGRAAVSPARHRPGAKPPAKPAVKPPARPAVKRAAKPAVKRVAKPAVKRAAKPAVNRAAKPAVKRAVKPAVKRAVKPAARPASGRVPPNRWLNFVEQHGVVLASARGPVPCVAEAVAGEPIIGSWWAHAKGKAIFAALSEIDDAADVRCFKLVDGKVTFVHRRVWPALARLASGGEIALPRVAAIQQEHMASGEHRNVVTPFPDWVPDDVARAATELSLDDARAQLGAWV